ncbi:MAG: family 10 glycosylhydrolase [Muribaculaceae bacterium]|nr:family 10 glycosylhydrolase [Muribaculaceae bacterium]
MKKMVLTMLIAILLAFTSKAEAPKREFRSAWMAGMGIDWPKEAGNKTEQQKELREYLDNFKRQNFTGVCIHVRPNADAYYKSTLEPWSSDLTGKRGKDPGWDPLAFAVEECHKRGLECYAWLNPFRITASSIEYTTPMDKEWIKNGWVMWGLYGSWRMFNPGIEEARRHCLDVFKEIYTNYDIDGMLFDDYFYPSPGMPGAKVGSTFLDGEDSESSDYDTWIESGSSFELYDWRRENVNSFVREVFDELQAERPDMRFGIGPAGVGHYSASEYNLPTPAIKSSDWQYDKIYADCLAWLADGSIDFISPQIYWARNHPTAPHDPLCEWWNMAADHFGRHCYTSIAAYKLESEFGGNDEVGWQEIAAQVDLSRKYTKNNSAGQIYYNTQSINGPLYKGLGDYIGENSYLTKALVPVVDWKEHPTYPEVSSLTDNNGELSWDAIERKGRTIIRYTVYAVPDDVTYESALAPDGDGIDSKYLVDVTYSPSYTLPADKSQGCWYAVCVYDGYGFENKPALVNYEGSDVAAVNDESAIKMTVSGNVVTFNRAPRYATVCNVAGVQIISESSVLTMTLPGPGVYIINADGTPMPVYVR